jgi:hypothetical protein
LTLGGEFYTYLTSIVEEDFDIQAVFVFDLVVCFFGALHEYTHLNALGCAIAVSDD